MVAVATRPICVVTADSAPSSVSGSSRIDTVVRFQISGSLTQPNVNQQFHLFVTVFVNKPAPEGWSLANGDV